MRATSRFAAWILVASFACASATVGRASPARAVAHAAKERAHLAIVSGDRQSARAFAASTGPGYETPFPRPLVVRVDDVSTKTARARASSKRSLVLRFTCVSRGCRFAPSEQGDDVTRVSPQAYDVRVDRGRATLPPTLSTDGVPGEFLVRVALSPRTALPASNAVLFHLTVR